MRDGSRRQITPREMQRQRRKQQIQRRRLVAALCLLVLIILIIVLIATCGGNGPDTTTTSGLGETSSTTLASAEYAASLTGESTDATGTFTMTYDADAEDLSFNLTLDALTGPNAATIYQKADDGSDAVVYTLYSETAEADEYSGVLAQGSIDKSKFTGPLEGKDIGDLIALVVSGQAYVKVGTTDDLNALTGQIAESTSTGDTTEDTTEDTTVSTDDGTTDTTASDEEETTTTKKTTTTTE